MCTTPLLRLIRVRGKDTVFLSITSGLIPQSRAIDPANVTNKSGVFHVKHAARFLHRISNQAVFFVNPRYVSITRGFCASSAAAPSNANSPVSST